MKHIQDAIASCRHILKSRKGSHRGQCQQSADRSFITANGKGLIASQHPPFRDPCHMLHYPYRKQALLCVNPMAMEAWWTMRGFPTFRHGSHQSLNQSEHLH